MQTWPSLYIKALKRPKESSNCSLNKTAFQQLKRVLKRALALGLPIQNKFQLYVYEKRGVALGVTTQVCGTTPQPVGYLSNELDLMAKGWPGCSQAFAAVSFLVPEAQKLILG
jgi:hypothetical protein